ncbi:hypothetical protein ODZ83_10230 [Acaricomes phytoseiuli]|uniref:hypothetical protein n=1 Tax=Acaricomes phytoseiuli TaxID=291968 RepID=UPI0022237EAD|nr:hypothetical protein [Acaricomes phytoseiuli]MCW1250546.1 hypothetical protein [Acaricomes phytoseiuli]
MAAQQSSAQSAAKWRSEHHVWIDHSSLKLSDAEWLSGVRRLTLWAVKIPEGLLPSLSQLEWLDIRGGSGTSIDVVNGCQNLTYLAVNQIRGLHDLSALGAQTNLRLLSLYGLPQVRTLPSLANLLHLKRLEIGSMKGFTGLGPLLEAPYLEELLRSKAVALTSTDPQAIAAHPSIQAFEWFAGDVPVKTWAPIVDRIGRPKARALSASDWFDQNR